MFFLNVVINRLVPMTLFFSPDKIFILVLKAKFSITNDTSDQTKKMVNELVNSIILGMLLVILVLMFFLGLRNSLFVGID